MGGFMFAWLVGEGIVTARWVKEGAPPTPGALLLPSAFYLMLAILAEYQPARFAATALAWGVDIAVLMQVIGKAPKQATGWPPPMINNPAVILPGGSTAAAGTASINTTAQINPAGAAPAGTGVQTA